MVDTGALASRARKHSHLDYDRRSPAGANEGLIVTHASSNRSRFFAQIGGRAGGSRVAPETLRWFTASTTWRQWRFACAEKPPFDPSQGPGAVFVRNPSPHPWQREHASKGTPVRRDHRRACADVLRPDAGGAAANRHRQGARARQCPGQAAVGIVQCTDDRRQGLAGFDASSWYGLVAPAKTPEPVLAKLRSEVAKALEAPDMAARIQELGSEPGTVFGSDFGAFMAAETRK